MDSVETFHPLGNTDPDEGNLQQSYEDHDPIKAQPYDPSHNLATGASTLSTVVSLVCLTVGVGMISLPQATAKMGWITFPFLVICAVLSAYCAKLLVKSMHAHAGWRFPSFTAVSTAALTPISPHFTSIVTVLQCGLLFGCCCLFLVIMGDNMHALIGPPITLHLWVIIFGFLLLPLSWLKGMKEAGHMAFLGLAASLILAAVIIREGLAKYNSLQPEEEPHRDVVVSDIGSLSVAFNIIVLSFGGHSSMPAIEGAMRRPDHWNRSINIAYTIICLIYGAVCVGGYLGFGTSADGNILGNLDSSSVAVKAARVAITLHVVAAFNLVLVPFSHYAESAFQLHMKPPGRRRTIAMVVLRSSIMLAAIFIASIVPYVGQLVSLISALAVIGMSFIFPPLFYWALFGGKEGNLSSSTKAGLLALIVLGVAGSGMGLVYSCRDLYDAIRDNPNPFDNFFWE